MHMTGRTAVVAIAALACTVGMAAQAWDDHEAFVSAKEIVWAPAPPSLPPGAKIAVLHGDPSKSGHFVLRLMTPARYKVPPHWHSQDEALTVISGTFYIGMGDHYEPSTARGLTPGGFHFLPSKAHHYAYSKKPTILQISGSGPFDITYVNPADDPRRGK